MLYWLVYPLPSSLESFLLEISKLAILATGREKFKKKRVSLSSLDPFWVGIGVFCGTLNYAL
jgi:hypothetical protein